MLDNGLSSYRLLLICVGGLALSVAPAVCAENPQSTNYSMIEVAAGARVQLGYYAFAKKDCSSAPVPAIRMIEPPKSGTLMVRRGLLTPNIAACPGLKIPAQVVFYAARPGTSGKDHLVYELTNPDGAVNVYDITIDIEKSARPDKSGPKSEPI